MAALSPLVKVTIRSALFNAMSNILAQAITAYRSEKAFVIDWVPVFQFCLFNIITTPPNFLWQEFLESTFPASRKADGNQARDRAAATATAAATGPPAAAARLSVRNTAAKVALDQTLGAGVNTLLFSVFMHGGQAAGWRAAGARARRDFLPIMRAGWRLWPFVSLFNFAVVESVQVRNLVSSLAGMGWGVYMSLVAAGTDGSR